MRSSAGSSCNDWPRLERLLIDATVMGPAPEKGAQGYARDMIEHLPIPRDASVIVATTQGSRPFIRKDIENIEVKYRFRLVWQRFHLGRLARSVGATHVWCLGESSAGPMPRGVKLNMSIHEVQLAHFKVGLRARLKQRLIGSGCRRSHNVLCLSESTASDARLYYGVVSTQIHVVYPGVSQAFFDAATDRASPDDYVFLTVTGDPRELPCEAVEGLGRSRFGPKNLHIGGSAPRPLVERLISIGKEHSVNVTSLGRLSLGDLASQVAGAAFVIEGSQFEGFGLQAAEGLAAGVPVLASDISAFREFMPPSVPLWRPSASHLAHCIDALYGANRDDVITEGRAIAEQFLWSKSASMAASIVFG